MHPHLVCLLGWDFHSFDLKHIIGLSDSSSFSYTQLPIYIIVAWPALQYARFNCRERLLQANCSWHWLQILEEVRGQIHGKSGLSGLHLALVAIRPSFELPAWVGNWVRRPDSRLRNLRSLQTGMFRLWKVLPTKTSQIKSSNYMQCFFTMQTKAMDFERNEAGR